MIAYPRRILELFGIEVPIIQAPMLGVTTSAMAIGVAEAGGLGSLPISNLSPDEARSVISEIRRQTSKPINVNFLCHKADERNSVHESAWLQYLKQYYDELGVNAGMCPPHNLIQTFGNAHCALIEEIQPEVVSFHFGLPAKYLLERVRKTGTRIMSSATTVEEAKWLEEAGCDAIIAQGFEAGGHRGTFLRENIDAQVGTMALVPQILDAVGVPVIAAGGIGDPRGVAAAFALGASAVQVGTAFLLCSEANISSSYRRALRGAQPDQTVITNVFTGRPARVLETRIVRELGPITKEAPAFPHAVAALAPLRATSEAHGSTDFTPLWCGQAMCLSPELPAAKLTTWLCEGFAQVSQSPNTALAGTIRTRPIHVLCRDQVLKTTLPEVDSMSAPTKLFDSFQLGPHTLPNRVVMAPLTRNRAIPPGMVPSPLAVNYYGQRASAGLLITEASQISQQGQGYQDTPGIYSKDQVAGWRTVTDAVHARSGRIFIQLWHVGRISHNSLQPGGGAPVAPSAIRARAHIFVNGTFTPTSEPRALELWEIHETIEDFQRGAANALIAGFDGVEIHGANGYLLDQFAKDGANKRTDVYGGSIENRARLMLEVSKAVAAEIGADRTGIRLSPLTPVLDGSDSNPQPLFDYIVEELNALRLVYIHVIEGATGGSRDIASFDYEGLRQRFNQAYIANNGYDFELATKALATRAADLIAFGKPFISNPDLVERLKKGAPLSTWDEATFYGGGAKGYTDYPILAARDHFDNKL